MNENETCPECGSDCDSEFIRRVGATRDAVYKLSCTYCDYSTVTETSRERQVRLGIHHDITVQEQIDIDDNGTPMNEEEYKDLMDFWRKIKNS